MLFHYPESMNISKWVRDFISHIPSAATMSDKSVTPETTSVEGVNLDANLGDPSVVHAASVSEQAASHVQLDDNLLDAGSDRSSVADEGDSILDDDVFEQEISSTGVKSNPGNVSPIPGPVSAQPVPSESAGTIVTVNLETVVPASETQAEAPTVPAALVVLPADTTETSVSDYSRAISKLPRESDFPLISDTTVTTSVGAAGSQEEMEIQLVDPVPNAADALEVLMAKGLKLGDRDDIDMDVTSCVYCGSKRGQDS